MEYKPRTGNFLNSLWSWQNIFVFPHLDSNTHTNTQTCSVPLRFRSLCLTTVSTGGGRDEIMFTLTKKKKHTLFIQSRENRRTAQLVRWKSISSNEESAQKARRAGDWKLQPQNPGSDKHTKNNNYWSLESRRKKKKSAPNVFVCLEISAIFFF